jgi:hypothetical protein
VRALDRLHIEVESSSVRIGSYGCISRVCKRAGLSVAKTRDIVLIATKVLLFSCPEES